MNENKIKVLTTLLKRIIVQYKDLSSIADPLYDLDYDGCVVETKKVLDESWVDDNEKIVYGCVKLVKFLQKQQNNIDLITPDNIDNKFWDLLNDIPEIK